MAWREFASCAVGGTTVKRQVLAGGLRAEFLDAAHGSVVARRTALASVGGSFEACFESRRDNHVGAAGACSGGGTAAIFPCVHDWQESRNDECGRLTDHGIILNYPLLAFPRFDRSATGYLR